MSTFNFASLQEKANQVLHNADEAISKWVDLTLAPAKDVPIEYYDKNGNLVQTTVPNRAKLFNDLLVNVNSAMQKTFYVDAVNGNDNNDGSSTAPFKTIKKAIDSVPVGGIGEIILQNEQTHYMPTDNDILITNKTIMIYSWNFDSTDPNYSTTNPTTIYITKKVDGTSSKFILAGNSVIGLGKWGRGIHIEDDPTLNVSDLFIYCHADVTPNSGNILGLKKVSIAHSTIKLNKAKLVSFPDMISLRWVGINFDISDSSHMLTDTGYGTLRIEVSEGYLHNIDGSTNLGWSYLPNIISGIVRDSNGVPRNVISNMIL